MTRGPSYIGASQQGTLRGGRARIAAVPPARLGKFVADDMAIEILETERLRLRPYSLADEAALFEVFADPYARRFYPEMRDLSRVRAWIEWNLRNYDE